MALQLDNPNLLGRDEYFICNNAEWKLDACKIAFTNKCVITFSLNALWLNRDKTLFSFFYAFDIILNTSILIFPFYRQFPLYVGRQWGDTNTTKQAYVMVKGKPVSRGSCWQRELPKLPQVPSPKWLSPEGLSAMKILFGLGSTLAEVQLSRILFSLSFKCLVSFVIAIKWRMSFGEQTGVIFLYLQMTKYRRFHPLISTAIKGSDLSIWIVGRWVGRQYF